MKKFHSEMDLDRISDMPEPIRRHILSFLTTKEAVRASVLSRSWQGLWVGLPCLDLSWKHLGRLLRQGKLPNINGDNAVKSRREAIMRKREEFYDFLDRALGSVWELEKLDVCVPGFGPELESRLDNWLDCTVGGNVKELVLSLSGDGSYPTYSLPKSVLNARSITKLTFQNFKLNLSKLTDTQLPFLPSLRELSLQCVTLDEGVTESILANCWALEELVLVDCGLERLKVSGLAKLKKVNVEEHYDIVADIEIDAPNLLEFVYTKPGYFLKELPHIAFSACKNMKRLVLDGAPVDDNEFHVFLESLPLLEYLALSECQMLERVEISSRYLVHLAFKRCMKLSEVRINTPNLKSFDYVGEDPIPFYSNGSTLNLAEASISLAEGNISLKPGSKDDSWYARLIEFLAKLCLVERLTLKFSFAETLIVPDEVRKQSLPPLFGVKHLMVDSYMSRPNHIPAKLVESLLWLAPCPRSISINNYNTGVCKVFKFTYESQMKADKKCGCWKSLSINCWRHSLNKVLITSKKRYSLNEAMIEIENKKVTANNAKLADFFYNSRTDAKIACFFEYQGPV